MRRLMYGIFGLVFIIGVLGTMNSQALAVSASGGIASFPDGRPMAGVKVRITVQNSDGSKNTTETDTNEDGFFLLPRSGGDVTKVEIGQGSSLYTFDRSLNSLSTVGGITIPRGAIDDSSPLNFNVARADSVTAAPSNGVWVTGKGGDSVDSPVVQLSFTVAQTIGSTGTSVTQNGNRTQGEDIDISQSSIRPDVRFFLGPLANLGNVGNLGNFGFLGMGNLGNMGNMGFGPYGCFVGGQGAIGTTGGNEGLNTNQHGADNEIDTTLKQKFKGAFTPYLGCSVVRFPNHYGYLNLLVGARISFWENTFSTGEDQGGGNFEQITQNETKVGPAIGVEYNNYFDYSNLDFMGDLGPSVQGGLQMGFWGEHLSGTDLTTRTENLGFDYTASTEGVWVGTIRAGIGVSF